MWTKLTNWWNKDKLELEFQLKQERERLDNTLHGFDKVRNELEDIKKINKELELLNEHLMTQIDDRDGRLQDEIDASALLEHEFNEFKKQHPDMKADGVLTPWFVVGVNGESDLKGLKTYIDWNDAMIQHMKDKNLGYKTDDEMIQHFIAQLYEHVLMLIERKVIEDSDLQRKNEFE